MLQRFGLLFSILLIFLPGGVAIAGEQHEDPRMREPAVIEAQVCAPELGCVWLHVAGPQMIENYGLADNPIPISRSLTLRTCNDFLASPLRFAEVQHKLAEILRARVINEHETRAVRCALAGEMSA